ncbi:MAG: hypothetical protein Q9M36_00105 [Sulfurovum sp.]|nr:hypothetical protein [Sulfurovum sp.]
MYSALENKHDMLGAITEVCNNKDMTSVDNKEQYFVYLEFLSHFDKTNQTELVNPRFTREDYRLYQSHAKSFG